MQIVKALREILVNDPNVSAITPRVYAYVANQRAEAPYVSISVVAVRPSDCKNHSSTLDNYRIQIDSVSERASVSANLDNLIRGILDRITPGQVGNIAVDGIKYDNSQMIFDDERKLRMIASDYDVRVQRDATLPYIPEFSGLQYFTDDEAAIAGGLVVGSFYIVAQGSDVLVPGTLKQVMP